MVEIASTDLAQFFQDVALDDQEEAGRCHAPWGVTRATHVASARGRDGRKRAHQSHACGNAWPSWVRCRAYALSCQNRWWWRSPILGNVQQLQEALQRQDLRQEAITACPNSPPMRSCVESWSKARRLFAMAERGAGWSRPMSADVSARSRRAAGGRPPGDHRRAVGARDSCGPPLGGGSGPRQNGARAASLSHDLCLVPHAARAAPILSGTVSTAMRLPVQQDVICQLRGPSIVMQMSV